MVIVLGDLGRSPRMMNHVSSLVDNGFTVDFIGYNSSSLPDIIINNPKIRVHSLPTPSKLDAGWPKWMYAMNGLIRVIIQGMHLLFLITILTSPTWIISQNPPAIPLLLIVQIVKILRNSGLIIDWHNFGYTLMGLNLGSDHVFVKIARIYERWAGRFATIHVCVSQGMRDFLKDWNVSGDIMVLYDKPPAHFKALEGDEKDFVFFCIF